MDALFFMVEEALEGEYSARALGTSIYTQGDTMDELRVNIRDAVDCHFDDAKPRLVRLHIIRDEILTEA